MAFILSNSLAESIQIEWIEEGFTSSIEMSAHKFESETGETQFFDDGATYDRLRSQFTAILNATELANLQTIYDNSRDGVFTLDTNGMGGLALFTPAFGDLGPFYFNVKSFQQTGALNSTKYKYFRIRFDVYEALQPPIYTPQAGNDEGNLQIGTTTGIRYPINDFNVSVKAFADTVGLAYSFNSSNDLTERTEKTKFKLRLLHDKMSALLKHLRTDRYGEIDFIVPNEVYPFGANYDGVTNFKVRLLNTELKVTQVKNKRYELELEFQRLSNV